VAAALAALAVVAREIVRIAVAELSGLAAVEVGGEAAMPRYEPVIGPDHIGLQQAEIGHAAGERVDVAHVLAVALADVD